MCPTTIPYVPGNTTEKYFVMMYVMCHQDRCNICTYLECGNLKVKISIKLMGEFFFSEIKPVSYRLCLHLEVFNGTQFFPFLKALH